MRKKENGSVPADTPRDDSSVEEQTQTASDITDAANSPRPSRKNAKKKSDKPAEKVVESERLQKLIARAGIASRRAAEELISDGRVFVNGRVVKELGAKANPQTDRVVVDGKPLIFSEKPATVILLHKPRGYVTTKSDPEKRAVVLDLLPKKFQHLHPVGRLDYDTAGVLLFTDDGDLTHLLTHPSHGIEKVYHARARGEIKTDELKKLEAGVWISEGEGATERKVKTAPCHARVRAQTASNVLIEVALREGRNRQVRKMLEAIGHQVSSLRRTSFAGVELEGLPSGAHRVLLDGEVHELRKRAARQLEKAKRLKNKTSAQEPDFDSEMQSERQQRRERDAKIAATKSRTASAVYSHTSQNARVDSSRGEKTSVSDSDKQSSRVYGASRSETKRSEAKRSSASRANVTGPVASRTSAKPSAPIGERIRREWK